MIELTQGQEILLAREDGSAFGELRMGVGWAKIKTAGFIGTGAPEVDLDASASEFGEGGTFFDMAFYNNLSTRDGAIVHLGDNKTGAAEGDDEVITVDLARVHPRIDTIVFLVSSYQGHSLEWISRAYCRLIADEDTEIARYTLTHGVPETGLVLAKIFRDGVQWKLRTIGRGIPAKVPSESVDAMRALL